MDRTVTIKELKGMSKVLKVERELNKLAKKESSYISCTTYEGLNSTKQIQKLIAEADHISTQRERDRLKKKGTLSGWKKQDGLGSIPMFNTLLGIEKEIKAKLKLINEALANGTYSQWHNMFGDPQQLERNLVWAKTMLEEFRKQRDNPRFAGKGENDGKRRNKKTKGSSSSKAGDSGNKS